MSSASESGPDGAEALALRRRKHDHERLLMLSDGVFAIAITLAALEIRAPERATSGPLELLRALAPALMTYGISFLVIAAYWSAHRRIFSMMQRVDAVLLWLNLVLLGLVALQPAGVALLTRLGPYGGALQLYLGLILAIGLAQTLMWAYAAFVGRLLDPLVGMRYRLTQLVLGLVLPVLSASLILFASRSGSPAFLLTAIAVMIAMGVARRHIGRQVHR